MAVSSLQNYLWSRKHEPISLSRRAVAMTTSQPYFRITHPEIRTKHNASPEPMTSSVKKSAHSFKHAQLMTRM
jgi:hypothetical protein